MRADQKEGAKTPGPHMVCPVCLFVPEIDRELGAIAPGHTTKRPEGDRWLEYVAHLLEHLVGVNMEEKL